jgi:DNA-binding Xre family transcriptional regulator
MAIREPPTLEQVARPPVPPNFRLKAAQASLVAAFQDRVARDPIVQSHKEAGEDWQRPLAARMGISQASLNQINAGKIKDVRLSMLLKLRDYIGLTLDEILGLRPFRPDTDVVPDSSRTRARSRER